MVDSKPLISHSVPEIQADQVLQLDNSNRKWFDDIMIAVEMLYRAAVTDVGRNFSETITWQIYNSP